MNKEDISRHLPCHFQRRDFLLFTWAKVVRKDEFSTCGDLYGQWKVSCCNIESFILPREWNSNFGNHVKTSAISTFTKLLL